MTFRFVIFQQTQAEWQIVFYITAVISLSGAIVYLVLGSGELQPWAASDEMEKEEDVDIPLTDTPVKTNDESEKGKLNV